MYKWRITNVSTGEIWEKDKEFKAPMAAFQSIRMFVRGGLLNMWIDAGDKLVLEILDANDEVVIKSVQIDAAYFPSLEMSKAYIKKTGTHL